MKFYSDIPLGADVHGIKRWLNGVAQQRRDDVKEVNNLKSRLVEGRWRTERTAPTANSDINANDKEGDIVRSATYEYIVINDSGTLKWARHALDVSW